MPGFLAGPATGAARLDLTPACGPADHATPARTEGPFFTVGTPEKHDFRRDGRAGIPITLAGFVLDRGCQPIAGARVELWHADSGGQYDNVGFDLRGHQLSDSAGRYAFETIMPGIYAGRTRHFHVKVAAPGRPVLTTQLYFPGERGNRRDRLFDARLVMALGDAQDGKVGRFDFVVGG